jgi:hypothetical protein
MKLPKRELAVLVLFVIGACDDDKNDGQEVSAVRVSSGVDAGLQLKDLSQTDRDRFCAAATATLYSATTVERECELESIVNEEALAGVISCEEGADSCTTDFLEVAELKCSSQIVEAADCAATVGDGEECSFATASLRAMLLPQATCSSDQDAKSAAIQGIYAANVFEAIPACDRYATCRRTL